MMRILYQTLAHRQKDHMLIKEEVESTFLLVGLVPMLYY